jgi:hypothetical protein
MIDAELIEGLRSRCRRAEEVRDDLQDAVECLRRVGELIGCDHVEGRDERAALVRCVTVEIRRLRDFEATATARLDQLHAQLVKANRVALMAWDDLKAVRDRSALASKTLATLVAANSCPECKGAGHIRHASAGYIRVCHVCRPGLPVDKSLIPGKRWG